MRKGMVCEVRSDVRVHPSSSHSVGRCGSVRCLHHRCAQGGPFPSIIHLNRRPIGALVSILPPLPPFPPSFTFPLSCPPPFLSLPPSSLPASSSTSPPLSPPIVTPSLFPHPRFQQRQRAADSKPNLGILNASAFSISACYECDH